MRILATAILLLIGLPVLLVASVIIGVYVLLKTLGEITILAAFVLAAWGISKWNSMKESKQDTHAVKP